MHTTAPLPPAPVRDPRDFVTPDALHVAHELLGLPLARPWRRAAAMAVDGILVAILSNAPSVLFGLAAALVLLRVATRRKPGGGYVRHSLRLTFAFGGAILLFVVALNAWHSVARRIGNVATATLASAADPPSAPDEPGAAAPGDNSVTVTGADGQRTAAAVLAFRRASDPAHARTLADAVVRSGRESGIADADIHEMMNGIAADAPDRPWLRAAVDSALARAAIPAVPDTARAPTTVDSLTLLRTENQRLSARNAKLQTDLKGLKESSTKPDLVSFLESFVKEEFGLGIGWVGLYFVATVALFRGRTPGKRLLGIRIIRLNGKPIGWWAAFERFGGYAAGLATGLLGFFQIFWDQNRQAIHDRIAETVVIDERIQDPGFRGQGKRSLNPGS